MGRELGERLPEEARRLGHGVGRYLVLDSQHPPLRVEEQRLRPIAVDGATEQRFVGSVESHCSALGGLAKGCGIEAELVANVAFARGLLLRV
jgi:hypothetical protein